MLLAVVGRFEIDDPGHVARSVLRASRGEGVVTTPCRSVKITS